MWHTQLHPLTQFVTACFCTPSHNILSVHEPYIPIALHTSNTSTSNKHTLGHKIMATCSYSCPWSCTVAIQTSNIQQHILPHKPWKTFRPSHANTPHTPIPCHSHPCVSGAKGHVPLKALCITSYFQYGWCPIINADRDSWWGEVRWGSILLAIV